MDVIYKDNDIDYTLMDVKVNNHSLWENLRNHDDLFVVGHGGPTGLFSTNSYGLFIDASTAPLLKREGLKNKILWCNAHVFIEKYDIKGFYTGMIISEVSEARYCGINNPTQDMVDSANQLLATTMRKYIHLDPYPFWEAMKDEYKDNSNPVMVFNQERIFFNK
jgi:hypothetical protein